MAQPVFLLQFRLPTMAHIEPFRALRYDPSRVALVRGGDPALRQDLLPKCKALLRRQPHNLVRIILGKQEAADNEEDERLHPRAAASSGDWRRQGHFSARH